MNIRRFGIMTINEIINLLQIDGINSKKLVIDKLSNLTYKELKTLERDVQARIALIQGGININEQQEQYLYNKI